LDFFFCRTGTDPTAQMSHWPIWLILAYAKQFLAAVFRSTPRLPDPGATVTGRRHQLLMMQKRITLFFASRISTRPHLSFVDRDLTPCGLILVLHLAEEATLVECTNIGPSILRHPLVFHLIVIKTQRSLAYRQLSESDTKTKPTIRRRLG